MVAKIGRPTRVRDKTANNRVNLRLTDEELVIWKQAAGNLPMVDWVRQACYASLLRGRFIR